MPRAFATRLAALAIAAACSPAETQTFDAKTRALDGDTVAVDFRLLGVDAFERRQLCQMASGCWECGKAAQDFSARALRDKTATIRLTPTSSYGRPVAIVTVDGADLGERLIRAGLAVPATQYLRADPQRASRYSAAFAQAKASRAGAFRGTWIDPSRWRGGERLACERRPSGR
ncbi:thermonuclease family protein [Sphingomonas sp. S-NIH.Pt3_0716]|nr:thermonuclease family protein [Sphingomonas sp. S-NIH.Pt3_0716]